MRWSEDQLSQYQARRAPVDLPPTPPVRKKPKAPKLPALSESEVHFAVVQHLQTRARPDLLWWHAPNGELRDLATAQKLRRMGILPGLPDLLLLDRGLLRALELKTETGGRVWEAQSFLHPRLEAAGAVVAVARGLDQALEILESWGAFRPANQRTDQ